MTQRIRMTVWKKTKPPWIIGDSYCNFVWFLLDVLGEYVS